MLKIELETYKLKCKALQEENRDLRKASVTIVSAPPGCAAVLTSARPWEMLPPDPGQPPGYSRLPRTSSEHTRCQDPAPEGGGSGRCPFGTALVCPPRGPGPSRGAGRGCWDPPPHTPPTHTHIPRSLVAP